MSAPSRPSRPGATPLRPSRLHPSDLFRVGSMGLRTRRTRTALSALGIAIGIAAMVSVLGISRSSQSDLMASLDRLGTNLLSVEAGGGIIGASDAELPAESLDMIGRIAPVEGAASITLVAATVRRSDLIDETITGGITVLAADVGLLDALGGTVADGAFLNEATATVPVAVLGSVAAERLGLTDVDYGHTPGPGAVSARILVGDEWFTVGGILDPVELAPNVDRAVIVGREVATDLFDTTTAPGTVYLRTDPDAVTDVQAVLAATANPDNPDQVEVSRPSDALEAKAAAGDAFTSLFLGLGAVALLVGGVGIANVMVISILERRSEIGLRRALGATRRHVGVQFLSESLLLSGLGGATGVIVGAGVTAAYAASRGWGVVIPPAALVGGFGAAAAIGAVAGLYPALRAARLAPTQALRTT